MPLAQDAIGHEPVSIDMLHRFDKPVPRYTSYPTAPEWGEVTPNTYIQHLEQLNSKPRPLSLYFHIPFCRTMCLFCGCSVILNRKPENEERYVQYLLKEMDLVRQHLREDHVVTQLHFGGGTPTKLTTDQLARIWHHIHKLYQVDPNGELAMEIDPRTVLPDDGEKLRFLRSLGFNRVSFGVQDTNPEVQEAVKRRQTYAMSRKTFELARELEFTGINLDLIYGLPYQTVESFQETVEKIAELRPDRIALFSYARVPWLKPHQNAIPEHALPSTEEKFRIYVEARKELLAAGYVALGMDHFALPEDPLAQAYISGHLHRNFQGYTLNLAEDMLGHGITAIGQVQDGFFQNRKTLDEYYQCLDQNELPVFRGKVLSADDCLRRWVIQSLMCQFAVDKKEFARRAGQHWDSYFQQEQADVETAKADGLLTEDAQFLHVTPIGRLFVRNVAALFDHYLRNKKGSGAFSKGV